MREYTSMGSAREAHDATHAALREAYHREMREADERLLFHFLEWLLPKRAGNRLAKYRSTEEKIWVNRWDDFWRRFKGDGTMDFGEFERFVRCDKKLHQNVRKLFMLLDSDGGGQISAHELLDWRRHYERSTDMKKVGLGDLKKQLVTRYGCLIRAWRMVFDVQGDNRCSQMTFLKGARSIGFDGNLKLTWAELTDGDIQRTICLRDLDPDMDQLLLSFVRAIVKFHGSLRDSWYTIMRAHNVIMTMKSSEFTEVCKERGFTGRQARSLFDAIDVNQTRGISLDEWLFLTLWESRIDEDGGGEPGVAAGQRREVGPAGAASAGACGGGGGAAAFEFVVVLTREEHSEYLRRRHAQQLSLGAAGGSGAATPGTLSRSATPPPAHWSGAAEGAASAPGLSPRLGAAPREAHAQAAGPELWPTLASASLFAEAGPGGGGLQQPDSGSGMFLPRPRSWETPAAQQQQALHSKSPARRVSMQST